MVGREKKKSLETVLWMSIWGCGSPACCCQPVVAGGFIYADLRLCLLSSPGRELLLQAFPFPSTLGEETLHQLSQVCVSIYSSHGKWAFSPLLCFPSTATFTSFPAPGCWAGATAPAFSGRLVYLQLHEGFPSPSLRCSRHPALFAMCLFCCYCLLFGFFFFFPWVGWSVQGAMLICPRVVCGSTACRLAHLVICIFPSSLGAGVWWWHGSPLGFSI
jgi:hypothetical protein